MSQGLILENEDYPLLTGRRCTLQALADDGMEARGLAICIDVNGHLWCF